MSTPDGAAAPEHASVSVAELGRYKQSIREAAARLDLLTSTKPASVDQLDQAQEILAGVIRFNGLQPPEIPRTAVTVGRQDIDWSGAHLQHQEWPTQLNRFFMLTPLITAYKASPDPCYAAAARDYIADWIAHVDVEDISLRGNTCMDIGIRLGTQGRGGWGVALALFMDCPSWDDRFIAQMLGSIERQALVLWKRGIPSRGGNHRIFGLDGLLHTALRFPFLSDAAAIRDDAVTGLRQAFQQQFLEDGAHVERTLQYHGHMTGIYVYLSRLGQSFPEAAFDLPRDRLLAAIDYLAHNLGCGINDHSAEAVDQDHTTAWNQVQQWRQQLTGDHTAPDWRPAHDAVFPDAGQVYARSSWETGADVLAFDAASYGGGHAHLARLGLVFRTAGRLWLADPGMFDYEMSNPFAIYGRSTPAHSTLNLNGMNQGIGDARLLHTHIDDEVVFLRGSYPGSYWSGVYRWSFDGGFGTGAYGHHERMVLWIRGDYLLIFDHMTCDVGNQIENVWQLAPVAGWEHDLEALSWRTRGEQAGFYLQMVLPPHDAQIVVHEGQRDPLRGWFCQTYSEDFVPAPQVVFSYPSDQNAFCAVLAMPLNEDACPPIVSEVSAPWGRHLELRWDDGRTDVVGLSSSLAKPLPSESPFTTDSPLVWLRLDPTGQPMRQFALNGTLHSYQNGETAVGSSDSTKSDRP